MWTRSLTAVVLLTALVVPSTAGAQNSDDAKSNLPVRFTAFAVSLGGIRTSSVATAVELTIDRWSTPQETARTVTLLKEKGADKLLDVLSGMKPVGTIRVPGNLAYDLHYAHQEPLPGGGRRIFLATNRPIGYWEAVNSTRTTEYPFTFIELRLDGQGEGEGKLALATKIDVSEDGKVVELVSYATQPIQLNEVKRQGDK